MSSTSMFELITAPHSVSEFLEPACGTCSFLGVRVVPNASRGTKCESDLVSGSLAVCL